MEHAGKKRIRRCLKWLFWSSAAAVLLLGLLLRIPGQYSLDVLIFNQAPIQEPRLELVMADKVLWSGSVDYAHVRKIFVRPRFWGSTYLHVEFKDGRRLSSDDVYMSGSDSYTYVFIITKDSIAAASYEGYFLFDVEPESAWAQAATIGNLILFAMVATAEEIAYSVARVLDFYGDARTP